MLDGKRRLFVIVYVGTVTVIHPHYIILYYIILYYDSLRLKKNVFKPMIPLDCYEIWYTRNFKIFHIRLERDVFSGFEDLIHVFYRLKSMKFSLGIILRVFHHFFFLCSNHFLNHLTAHTTILVRS